uniref:Nodule-specific cysteine-rich peptide L37 n=1 Tax=Lens culinaris TaxID=3864 RepID=A0A7T8DV93_LENCU|nr:nodule-specific cysteine-rich peptide L37 [Lens culinaris]
MVKILKSVYVIILFLFLFLVPKNIDGAPAAKDCVTKYDCPPTTSIRRYKCIKNKCRYTRVCDVNVQ